MEERREKKSTYIMLKLFLLIVCCMLHITHTLTHPTHTLCTTPITQTHTHTAVHKIMVGHQQTANLPKMMQTNSDHFYEMAGKTVEWSDKLSKPLLLGLSEVCCTIARGSFRGGVPP